MSATARPPAPRATCRLRRADCTGPGIRRRRQGRGFRYIDEDGHIVDDADVLQRIHELVIPPAWNDVWICPYPGGHIQATGMDAAGRKQYLYHQRWRARRDQKKFDDMVDFARALPGLRAIVESDLARDDMSREHVLACAVRLLDRGFFRVGSEDYAVRNDTYGLATMKKRHVRLRGDVLLFDYPSKQGKRRVQAVVDQPVAEVVRRLKARRGGGDDLLAYKRGRRWADLRSEEINEYLKDRTGGRDFSAKDFRTWGATVVAAVALAVSGGAPTTKTGRRRAITRAVGEVAYYLGNTPAVARSSYIDPRIFDRFRQGETIGHALPLAGGNGEAPAIQGPIEEAVLKLLTGGSGE
jgi:DNA topoisomerase IB